MTVHAGSLADRLGFPVGANTHPDPTIRRAYWIAIKRHQAARKLEKANAGQVKCARLYGRSKCGTRLEVRVDRSIGRTYTVCPRCERRDRGICGKCPRKISGCPRRAVYCDGCRHPTRRAQSRNAQLRDPEREKSQAKKRAKARRARLRKELRSKDPAVRAKAEAKRDRIRELNREAKRRFEERAAARAQARTN